MDISEQKTCVICGMRKPIAAFTHHNGKISAICSNCLKTDDGDDQGGGGFQVDIIDKLAAVTLEKEETKAEAAENFETVNERLNDQTEQTHRQDNQHSEKKYAHGLFNDRKTDDNKTSQQQANHQTDTSSQTHKTDPQDKPTATKTESASTQQTPASQGEKTQSNNSLEKQDSAAATPPAQINSNDNLSPAEKMKTAVTRSSLFAVIPSTLGDAKGNPSQGTDVKSATNNTLDDLASRFINNLTSGPGKR